MKIKVNPHKIEIVKEPVNEKEIDITKCEFEFADEITNDYVKEAYFTLNGVSYKQIIVNNECKIPYEVLQEKGMIEIGVVAFLVENEEEIKRYNPSPVFINTLVGSLKDNVENSEPITPTDKEQIETLVQQVRNEMDNLDIDAEKVGNTETITITKKDGTQEITEIYDGEDGIDGVGLNYNWVNTSLGVKREDEQDYTYVNLKGEKGDAGAIKMQIVNELPLVGSEDTIYLLPIEDPETGNNYDEYIYVNNTWEKLGGIQVEVDLTDYYTKQETYSKSEVNSLIPDLTDYVKDTDYATAQKGGVIKVQGAYTDTNIALDSNNRIYIPTLSYASYSVISGTAGISKATLENVITGKDLTTKAYVDSLIGDIDSVLDAINGEVI